MLFCFNAIELFSISAILNYRFFALVLCTIAKKHYFKKALMQKSTNAKKHYNSFIHSRERYIYIKFVRSREREREKEKERKRETNKMFISIVIHTKL